MVRTQPQSSKKYKKRQSRRGFKVALSFTLSLLLVFALEITLLSLASWQHQKAVKKEQLFTQLQQAQQQPVQPFSLPLSAGQKVQLSGQLLPQHSVFLALPAEPGKWRLITPFITNSATIMLDRGLITPPVGGVPNQTWLDQFLNQPPQNTNLTATVQVAPTRRNGWGGPDHANHPRVILRPDPQALAWDDLPNLLTTHYLQALQNTHPQATAIASPPPAGLPHRQYMWTWLSCALILPLLYGFALWSRLKKKD